MPGLVKLAIPDGRFDININIIIDTSEIWIMYFLHKEYGDIVCFQNLIKTMDFVGEELPPDFKVVTIKRERHKEHLNIIAYDMRHVHMLKKYLCSDNLWFF